MDLNVTKEALKVEKDSLEKKEKAFDDFITKEALKVKKDSLEKEEKAVDDFITFQKQKAVEESELVEELKLTKGLLTKAHQDLENKTNAIDSELEKVEINEVSTQTNPEINKVCEVTLAPEDERKGRVCNIPPLKPKERTKREESFQVSGPRLFNCMPQHLRNMRNCPQDEFKEKLDEFLNQVPDEPKIGGLMPLNFHQSNSLLHQVERRGERTD